jgi:hypothetical protein
VGRENRRFEALIDAGEALGTGPSPRWQFLPVLADLRRAAVTVGRWGPVITVLAVVRTVAHERTRGWSLRLAPAGW